MRSNEDKSFSLQFNPIANVKSVKEYEEEINTLKNEVFELKTQITHGTANVPKILYENNLKVTELAQENNRLKETINNLQNAINNFEGENTRLSEQLKNVEFVYNEKIELLRVENRKLIGRIEKLNNNAIELSQLKGTLSEQKGNSEQLKNIVIELEKQIEILKIEKEERDNEIYSCQSKIRALELEIDEKNMNKTLEDECYKRKFENELETNNRQERFISDLKEKINQLVNDKNRIESGNYSIERQRQLIETLERQNNFYFTKFYEISNSMGNIKTVFLNKVSEFKVKTDQLEQVINNIKKSMIIEPDNIRILRKLNIRETNINKIMSCMKDIINSKTKEIHVLETELKDTSTVFKSGHGKLIENLKLRIKDGLKELETCREYLKKKSDENKTLKTDISKLKNNQTKYLKQIDNAKKFYEGIKNKYGREALKIKI
ncbi:hypothetical protein A0H76_1903 [Hepatospora eriocheir]|uniref:Uncharacterized protein n=1 Tax=Hepatospora eriocheir TaxID=1081669 RepID=A0A1X0QKI2_9MICR|nr:hypothetical protein A0H76_1903 [Hepatospora eriocheir]